MKTTIRKIVDLLWCPDETKSSIGRKVGRHRDTIRKFETNMTLSGLNKEELDALDDVQLERIIVSPKKFETKFVSPNFDQVLVDLKKPGVTIRILYGNYVEDAEASKHPTKTPMSESLFYSNFRDFRKARNPEYRHDHPPGTSMQFDFSGKRPFYLTSTGQMVSAELAVSVLPHSGLTFAIALASQSLPDCTEAFVSSLEYFGGVPDNAVFDNFKAAVDRPRRGTKPAKINIHTQACLDHYQLFPDPARSYSPRDKGMVEKMVQEVQRSFLGKERHLDCYSLADLNKKLKEALDEINHRPMQKRGGRSRWQIFKEEEFVTLSPLPATRYEFGLWQVGLTVPLHYHVYVDGLGYSVPSRFIGQQVNVKATAKSVEIYAHGVPVAVHQRSNPTSGRVTDPDHLPPHHQAMTSFSKDTVIRFSESLSPVVAAFVKAHLDLHKNVKAAGTMVRKLSRKIQLHGRLAVEAALSEALKRGQINAMAVYSILERRNGDYHTDLPSPAAPSGNIRGADYYSDSHEDDEEDED